MMLLDCIQGHTHLTHPLKCPDGEVYVVLVTAAPVAGKHPIMNLCCEVWNSLGLIIQQQLGAWECACRILSSPLKQTKNELDKVKLLECPER